MTNYLTEAQMNIYFGWAQGSDMHGVYVHLSGRDVNDAILKVMEL
jgi:integrase/recombinase XerD